MGYDLSGLRGKLLGFLLRMRHCKVGKNFRTESVWHVFSRFPLGNVEIGDDVYLGHRVCLQVKRRARLKIGNRAMFAGDTRLCALTEVTVGNDCLIAEFCSIRDGNHGMDRNRTIREQPHCVAPIAIGNDVWIGAGCRVLKGANIPDGVVIGANSVVLGKSQLDAYGIYAGSPVKKCSERK